MLDEFKDDLLCKDVWFGYLLTAPNFLQHSLLQKLILIDFSKFLLQISAEISKKHVFSIKTTTTAPLRCCKQKRIETDAFIPPFPLEIVK